MAGSTGPVPPALSWIYTLFQKSDTPTHIDNLVSSQWIFILLLLAHTLVSL